MLIVRYFGLKCDRCGNTRKKYIMLIEGVCEYAPFILKDAG